MRQVDERQTFDSVCCCGREVHDFNGGSFTHNLIGGKMRHTTPLAGFILNLWMLILVLFTAAIGTVVLQVEYHMPPTPWIVAAACITGSINVLLFVVFMWVEYKNY